MLILGIDAGNYDAKIVGEYGIDKFRTPICDWFVRDVVEVHSKDDMEFEIDGQKGFAGPIALHEDIFDGGSMFGDSKAHEDTKVRILLGIYRYIEKYCPGVTDVSLVTGQPIISHNDDEKQSIVEMLKDTHDYVVNGKRLRINIHNVGVAPEGSGAFWSSPANGTVRIIDVGSGTVNVATMTNRRHINNASGTFNFGMETTNDVGLESTARGIIRGTTRLRWKKNDNVLICGGIAKEILPYIAAHYENAKLMQPLIQSGGDVKILDPVYSNAVGFYKIAQGAFG